MRLVTLCISLLATITFTACSRLPDTIKIGVAQPFSGPVGQLGKDMFQGVELAVNELNASGAKLDGKPLRFKIVAVDDRGDAEVGEKVARQLVDEGVVAVVGHLNSGVSIRTAPIYAASNIPQFAVSTQPTLTQLGFQTTLRLVASDSIQGRAMGSYAASLAGNSYALVDDGSSYGKALAGLAEQSLKLKGKQISLRLSLDDKTTDFAALTAELKAHSVDVIVTTLADFQVDALVAQLASAGINNLKIVGSDTAKTDKLIARKLPIEVFATSPVLEPAEFYRGKAFVDRFTAAYGTPPVYAAHYAYDAVHMLASAIQKAHSVDGKVLTRTLRDLDFVAPVTSTMKFGKDGEQAYGSVGVYRPRNGRWEPLVNSDRW